MGIKSNGGGEIVQVQGGHIIRATGRKDRHSKVFTAKGPRDRRVRLSAHTAIQFYDVQDRLGYDRPSKAVDWLIKNAKASIDKLAELRPWDPISGSASTTAVDCMGSTELPDLDHTGTSYHHQQQQLHSSNAYVPNEGAHDSMKSFFPTTSEDNPMSFQSYPHDLISRGSNQNQDLCLSLHSFQDSGSTTHQTHDSSHDQALFQGSGSLGFDGGPGGWAEQQHHQDMGRFTRLMGWADGGGGGGGSGGEGRGGILFHPSLSWPPQAYSQRGTLQSSFAPLVDNHNHHHQHHSSISGIGIGSDGFMGFCFPSQIHGELHGGASSSSLSPDSSQH